VPRVKGAGEPLHFHPAFHLSSAPLSRSAVDVTLRTSRFSSLVRVSRTSSSTCARSGAPERPQASAPT
jgi:hypothetical protein